MLDFCRRMCVKKATILKRKLRMRDGIKMSKGKVIYVLLLLSGLLCVILLLCATHSVIPLRPFAIKFGIFYSAAITLTAMGMLLYRFIGSMIKERK